MAALIIHHVHIMQHVCAKGCFSNKARARTSSHGSHKLDFEFGHGMAASCECTLK